MVDRLDPLLLYFPAAVAVSASVLEKAIKKCSVREDLLVRGLAGVFGSRSEYVLTGSKQANLAEVEDL